MGVEKQSALHGFNIVSDWIRHNTLKGCSEIIELLMNMPVLGHVCATAKFSTAL